MSIPAPNFTQTPNVVFDYWMRLLSGAQWKVLCCICRKIFGWHKPNFRDHISMAQLEEMTGLHRKNIMKAIKVLIGYDLIKRIVLGKEGQQETFYEIKVINEQKQETKPQNSNNLDPARNAPPTPRVSRPTKERELNKEEKLLRSKEEASLEDFDEGSSSFLKTLNLGTSRLRRLLADHSVAKITNAIKRCVAWKGRSSDQTGLYTCLRDYDDWREVQTVEDIVEKNKAYLKTLYHFDGLTLGGYRIVIGNTYFEASAGQTLMRWELTDKNFIENTKRCLLKLTGKK